MLTRDQYGYPLIKLIAYWPASISKRVRKFWLRRQLAHAQYEIDFCRHMQAQHSSDLRYWQAQQALIQSELRQI